MSESDREDDHLWAVLGTHIRQNVEGCRSTCFVAGTQVVRDALHPPVVAAAGFG